MSSSDASWVELASQHERVIQAGDSAFASADEARMTARIQWAELASQSERLVGVGDPLFRLASSRRDGTGMRLVASAA
jgi:hypothetical protein